MKLLVVMALAACGSPQRSQYETQPEGPHAEMAADDDVKPGYGKADLEKALIAERGAEATNERKVADAETKGDSDAMRVAAADLAVRRRFIASLENCQSNGHLCPPRIDDPQFTFDISGDVSKPPLENVLRFDLADWQKLTAELHGLACSCRTLACVDAVDVAANELESHPTQDVRGDEQSSAELTRARECLFRLRGKSIAKITSE